MRSIKVTRDGVVRSGRRLQVPLLVLREYRSTVPIGVEGVPTLSGFSESPGARAFLSRLVSPCHIDTRET